MSGGLNDMEVVDHMREQGALQKKKHEVRKQLVALVARGALKNEGQNKAQHYSYFTEAQCKKLFNELFSEFGIEFKFDTKRIDLETCNRGYMCTVECECTLLDVDTGYSETVSSYGVGMDNGDKAIYIALTGALKYFMFLTFMVATGTDAEKNNYITLEQIQFINKNMPEEHIQKMLNHYNISAIQNLSRQQAQKIILKIKENLKRGENNEPYSINGKPYTES